MTVRKKAVRKVRKSTPCAARYVAVVMRKRSNYSLRPHQDWSCFVDGSKEHAVKRALKAAREWEVRYSPYGILVGKLTESVFVPVQFEFEKL